MVLLLVRKVYFSSISRTTKFATKKAKATLYKREKIAKENRLFDGMNSYNTNYLEIGKPSERALELKPTQHPVSLNDGDSNIVSYKIPPKNLTPYYSIPHEALAPMVSPKFESPQGSK